MAKTAILSVRIVSDAKDSGFKKAARDVQQFELKVKKSLAGAMKSIATIGAKAGLAATAITGIAAPIAAIGVAAWQAIAPVAGLTAAMAPAALSAAALGVATLKTAFSGLGDALKATDPAAFADAIADMPPAMQAAATSLRALKDGFSDIGDTVRTEFWEPLNNLGSLQALISPIGNAMAQLAREMGVAASGLVDFISQGSGLEAVKRLIDTGATAMGSLARAAVSTVKGIIAVGAAAAPTFTQLAAKIDTVAAAWRDRMIAGFTDGTLQQYFTDAATRASAFMDVIRQIGGIVGAVFTALVAAGAPFLGSLSGIVAATHAWVQSAQGVATLNEYFSQAASAVAALAPILGQIAGIVVGTFMPAIYGLVQTLAPAISSLVDAFGGLAAALLPLMAPVGQIAALLGTMLAAAIQAVLPIIQQLASILQAGLNAALEALQPIMPVIISAFQQLSVGLQPLMPAFKELMQAVVRLIPPFVQFASAVIPPLISILSAIVPVVAAVISGFARFLSSISPLISIVGSFVSGALTALAAILRVVAAVISPVIRFLVSLGAGFGTVIGIAGRLVGALGKVGEVLSGLSGFFGRVSSAVSGLVGMVGRLIGSLSRIRFPSPPAWLSKIFSEPIGMDLPDWENIAFGQFSAGDTLGRLARMSANTNSSPATAVNVTVNVTGMVTADKVELAETIKNALTTHARVLGRTTAVGV